MAQLPFLALILCGLLVLSPLWWKCCLNGHLSEEWYDLNWGLYYLYPPVLLKEAPILSLCWGVDEWILRKLILLPNFLLSSISVTCFSKDFSSPNRCCGEMGAVSLQSFLYLFAMLKARNWRHWLEISMWEKANKSNKSMLVRVQRSGIDTIKYHTWPRTPMGKWQTHSRHHKREARGQPFPSRWPQSTHKQTRTKTQQTQDRTKT